MKTIFITILLLQINSEAYTIKQLLNNQNLVSVKAAKNEKAAIGDEFLVSGDKNQCLLKVIEVKKENLTLDSSSCNDKSILSVGDKIEKSLFASDLIKKTEVVVQSSDQTIKNEQIENKSSDESYKALILGYMLNPKLKFGSQVTSGTTIENVDFEYTLNSNFKIGFEWSQFKKNEFNHGILIDYTKLDFSDIYVSSTSSGSASGTINGSMSIFAVAYAPKLRFDQIYIPINIGFSNANVDSSAPLTKTIVTRLYLSLGVGFVVSQKINLELLSNVYSTYANKIVSGGTSIVPEIGYLSSLQFNTKILF